MHPFRLSDTGATKFHYFHICPRFAKSEYLNESLFESANLPVNEPLSKKMSSKLSNFLKV
jgi:hypothetical protein